MNQRTYLALSVAFLFALTPATALAAPVVGTTAASTDVTTLDSCAVIERPGTYVLSTDITYDDTDVCIDIRSNDVRFDGSGHTISGSRTEDSLNETAQGPLPPRTDVAVGVGIETPGSLSRVTVTGVTVTHAVFGIYATDLSAGRIETSTATTNTLGIVLNNASDSVVTNSTAIGNFGPGILVDSFGGRAVSNNTISENTANGNGFEGIGLYNSSRSVVTRNTASENTDDGIVVGSFTDEDVVGNRISDSTTARNGINWVELFNASDTTITNVTANENFNGVIAYRRLDRLTVSNTVARNNSFLGISVDNGEHVTIADNDAGENGYVGIDLANSNGERVTGNQVSANRGTVPFDVAFPSAGYLFSDLSNTAIANNDATGVNASGFVVRAGSEVLLLASNTARENAVDGIAITNSTWLAVVFNTATTNGDDGVEVTGSRRVLLLRNTLVGNGGRAVEINDSRDVRRIDSLEDLWTTDRR